jgi:hypothetical protein
MRLEAAGAMRVFCTFPNGIFCKEVQTALTG